MTGSIPELLGERDRDDPALHEVVPAVADVDVRLRRLRLEVDGEVVALAPLEDVVAVEILAMLGDVVAERDGMLTRPEERREREVLPAAREPERVSQPDAVRERIPASRFE